MAKKESIHEPKDLVEALPEEISKLEKDSEALKILESVKIEPAKVEDLELKEKQLNTKEKVYESWIPKTALGKMVKEGKFKTFDEVLSSGKRIFEPEIADVLLPLETDLLLIGQAKGKFGGGKRRAWRQTQKKTMEGNVVTFSCMAVIGDKKGHVGLGFGKQKKRFLQDLKLCTMQGLT